MKVLFWLAVALNLLLVINLYFQDKESKARWRQSGFHRYSTEMEKHVTRHGEGARARGLVLDFANSLGASLIIHFAALLGIIVRLCQRRWRDALKWTAVLPATAVVMFGVYWLLNGVLLQSAT